jgi:DNA sulfur modification protein DndB
MATYIPAIRARMGDVEYYSSVMTLGEAARLIQYVEEVDDWTSETPPELKLQRKLNVQRVEREMVPYLTQNPDHFYSALTVEIRPAPYEGEDAPITFEEQGKFPGGTAFGMLALDGTETLYALDGQHRLKSMELAIRQKPELAREHIVVVLVPFRAVVRSQTLFSDLNRYARPTSKSTSLLFTHREKTARVAKQVAQAVPLLRDRVEMERTSLSKNAPQFITLSTLYEMTRTIIREHDEESDDEHELVADLVDVWRVLTEAIAEWGQIAASREHPAWLRQRYLHGHGSESLVGERWCIASVSSIGGWRTATGTTSPSTVGGSRTPARVSADCRNSWPSGLAWSSKPPPDGPGPEENHGILDVLRRRSQHHARAQARAPSLPLSVLRDQALEA